MDLTTLLRERTLPEEEIRRRCRRIHESVIADSHAIKAGAFKAIAVADLEWLFARYDELFFGGAIGRRLEETGHPLVFSLSRRMTKTGGKTKFLKRRSDGAIKPGAPFEIIISVVLLYQTFSDVERIVRVNGIECADRLEALQRVFEHELVHLTELLVWGDSKCSAPRFGGIAHRFFGHTEVTHDMVTQAERAATSYEVAVGDTVSFEHEGRRYTGKVNRITKRATVLVEDERGAPYSDGKRYLKFYVPISILTKS